MLDDPVLKDEIREFLENEDDTLISREDIENSLKKYEELSRQLSETKRSLEQYGDEGYVEETTTPRRTSCEDERSNDGEEVEKHGLEKTLEALAQTFARPSSGHGSEEEERSSRSDDELMRDVPQEEERSKSDGDKDEEDDDAIPLRIQASQKSNKLTLSNCWLKTIPSEVWDLTHLTELDLSANYLKKVSKSIGNLTLLKRLRLNHNHLTILPKEIWSLTKLTTLLLNNNNIKVIPKEIKNLTKLKALDLSSNQLSEIPVKEGIMQLPSLAELRLRNNQLTTLPAAMAEMTQLQVLWLEGNPMPVPKTVLKRNAGAILSYMKDHPNFAKRPSIDAGNPRVLRKSPPAPTVVNSHGHVPGKKDLGILAEKELKKRKREQLEEMRKHLEVEKKVKHLEHELMLANAKAMKFEEEATRVVQPVHLPELLSPVQPGDYQTPPQPQTPAQSVPQPQGLSPGGPPPPFPGVHFGQIPPHVPRQQGPPQLQANEYKPYPPVPPPIHVQQQQQQQQQLQQQQQQLQQQQQPLQINPPNPLGTSQTGMQPPAAPPASFEWEIPLLELSFGPRIGRGGYGEVYRGMWGGTEVAVKMLFTDNMNAKLLDDLRKEVDLLCKLRHPNILLFMGACTEPGSPCIVTEFLARGSLASILMDHSVVIDWGLSLQIGIDTARGMAYLHSRNPVIIHRDLKTDNLLVDDNWQVKLADFGLATVKSRTFAKTMCGTTGWVAPEVLAEQGYTEKADVYSFAVILWELLTRQVPYAGKNTMQVVRSIDRGERLIIPATCPPDYSRLINLCWDTDPSVRPPFTLILTTLERMRAD
jgi:tRNA A-37 threonylcarbamoyl transferase component Bud32